MRRSLCLSAPPPLLKPTPSLSCHSPCLAASQTPPRACAVHDPNFFWPVVFFGLLFKAARCPTRLPGAREGAGAGVRQQHPFGRMMYVALSIWSSRTSVWPNGAAGYLRRCPKPETGLQVLTWPATNPALQAAVVW